MRRIGSLAFAIALLAAAPHVAAQDAPQAEEPAPAPDPEAAGRLSAEAFAALESGDAERAAELFAAASRLAPEAAALRYDRGVALARAGKLAEAAQAWRESLSGTDDEVDARALFNLGALHLGQAREALELARASPEEIAQRIAAEGDVTPEEARTAAEGVRAAALREGVGAAESSVSHLRDLLRRAGADRDAAHNLELAQSTWRALREEQRKQQEQQQQEQREQQEQDPSEESEEGGEPEPKDAQDPQAGEPPRDPEAGEQPGEEPRADPDEAPRPDEPRAEGDPPESPPQPSEGAPEGEEAETAAAPEAPEREEAERVLERMVEEARRRARAAREARERAARRVPVEKDW